MITGVEERSVNTESAAIRGITGAADSHATFGPVINRIENLLRAAESSLNGFSGPHHGRWSTIVENEIAQFFFRELP